LTKGVNECNYTAVQEKNRERSQHDAPEQGMSRKLLDEVYEEIKRNNLEEGEKMVPHSDEFIKYLTASMGVSEDMVKRLIKILINSHMIFSFEVVHQDEIRNIPQIEGYVITDSTIIRNVKNYYQRQLVMLYSKQFKKDLMVHQVVKEIFPIIRTLNNTGLGKVANKSIMLEELEKLLDKDFQQYTSDFKEKQLEVELSKANFDLDDKKKSHGPGIAKTESNASATAGVSNSIEQKGMGRAVDSKRYQDFVSKKNKYPLQRIINIYGMDFFLKVNLRNHQFTYLKQLIEDNQIQKRSDLLLLKDLLRVVKMNADRDDQVQKHIEDVYALERTLHHKMYFSDRRRKTR